MATTHDDGATQITALAFAVCWRLDRRGSRRRHYRLPRCYCEHYFRRALRRNPRGLFGPLERMNRPWTLSKSISSRSIALPTMAGPHWVIQFAC